MKKNHSIKTIALLSILHFFIDFLCAYSLYNNIYSLKNVLEIALIYNYCAFVLQLPLGALLDRLNINNKIHYPLLFVLLGIIFTIVGSYTNNIILGIGNALFHVGGGVISIKEDDLSKFKGRGLGTFVAPGAIGLLFGKLLSNNNNYNLIKIIIIIVVLLIALITYLEANREDINYLINKNEIDKKEMYIGIVCTFIVVILRSLIGMSVSYSWRNTTLLIIISVFALAFGKTAGGFLCAKFGKKKTIIVSLILSAICFVLGNNLIFGLLSLFLFNMTMPITLYILKDKIPNKEGTAFGILTVGLFIGYLPTYLNIARNLSPIYIGSISSIISMVLLLITIRNKENE